MIIGSCKAKETTNIEIQPALHSIATDSLGRHEQLIKYSSVICKQDKLCTLDFTRDDTFENPLTKKRETYPDGIMIHLRARLVKDMVSFEGSSSSQMDLGVTAAYEDKDGSLDGQTFRQYTAYFHGKTALNHEVSFQLEEDIENGVFLILKFKKTTELPSALKKEEPIE